MSQSGEMSEILPLVQSLKKSVKKLRSSLEGGPANRYLMPGSEEARQMTVTSGLKCLESSTNSDQLGLLEKTLLGSELWGSTKRLLTWKIQATPSGRSIFLLSPSVPTMKEKESSLWRTPNTMDSLPMKSQEALTKEAEGPRKGRAEPNNLRDQVAVREGLRLWPTPTVQEIEHFDVELSESGRRLTKDKQDSHSLNLADSVRIWPTPTARDWKGQNSMEHIKGRLCGDHLSHVSQLPNAILYHTGEKGGLNPVFVEMLMKFPPNWTFLQHAPQKSQTEKKG